MPDSVRARKLPVSYALHFFCATGATQDSATAGQLTAVIQLKHVLLYMQSSRGCGADGRCDMNARQSRTLRIRTDTLTGMLFTQLVSFSHFSLLPLAAASGVIAFESDEKVVNGAASIEAEHSSLVPLDAEVLLEGPYYQCTWLHPAAMPAGGPQPLALAPPPPLVLQSGPVFEDSSQTETLPPPSQPQTTKNKTASIVRDGGVKETERSNVASSQDGARLLFANPCVSHSVIVQ